jgi:phage gpG-like protein
MEGPGMIKITGLRALSDRLARLDINAVQQAAMQSAATTLQDAVQQTLSGLPGGDHSIPWRQTGALRDSIVHQSDSSTAIVGSSNPVAVHQELGTGKIPPRPFFSPTATAHAPELALNISGSIAAAIRVATKDGMQ